MREGGMVHSALCLVTTAAALPAGAGEGVERSGAAWRRRRRPRGRRDGQLEADRLPAVGVALRLEAP